MWSVQAEGHDGKTYTLRKGFPDQDSAEDHVIIHKYWRRVWVEKTPAERDADKPFAALLAEG